jgi:hypothetical protein
VPKKAQFTHERVEYNVFLFDEPLKGSKSLKTFKISLTFRFDKLSHLSKSVHIGENYQILTVSNKKIYFIYLDIRLIISSLAYIPGDSDWYSRPYIFFILRKKYNKPYIFVNRL